MPNATKLDLPRATLPADKEARDLRQLRRLARLALRRYRDHEDWEDILQEAWLESWRQWRLLEGRYAMTTVVRVCARSAFTSWVRSRKGRRQWRPAGRRDAPEWVFLAELPEADWPESRDPAPQVIRRVAAEQEAALALAAMTVRQAECVRSVIMEERPYRAAAVDSGVTGKTVWKLVQTGLEHGRRALVER